MLDGKTGDYKHPDIKSPEMARQITFACEDAPERLKPEIKIPDMNRISDVSFKPT